MVVPKICDRFGCSHPRVARQRLKIADNADRPMTNVGRDGAELPILQIVDGLSAIGIQGLIKLPLLRTNFTNQNEGLLAPALRGVTAAQRAILAEGRG